MTTAVIVQVCAIHEARGDRLWMLGAFWSLPLQLPITLIRWANEAATKVADRVGTETGVASLPQ
jgi:hypothetical protein